VIRVFKPGTWASLSAAYVKDGTSTVDGDRKDDDASNFISALSLGFQASNVQSVKIAYIRGRTRNDTGSDFDSLLVGWSLSY